MTSRWLKRSSEQRDDAHLQSVQAALTTAFLDLENRHGIVESALRTVLAFGAQPELLREFAVVRDACYNAASAYLVATGAGIDQIASNMTSTERSTTIGQAQQLLSVARNGLDAFQERHHVELNAAASRVAAVTAEADVAMSAADDARSKLAQTDDSLRAYPSVQRASDHLEAVGYELQMARDRRDLRAVADCTARLTEALRAITDALDAAPHREEQARRALAAVRTRVDALRYRADRVGPHISTLLREFHVDSSAGLLGNEQATRSYLDRADALLTHAVAAHCENRPETALELVGRSRTELAGAERLIDAVAERLATLRGLRNDPTVEEREARFRVRDAQRLAVDRGAVEEWGTPLDAQVERIDRAVAALGAQHPDYWAYHCALQDVSQFVDMIVARIRQRSAQ